MDIKGEINCYFNGIREPVYSVYPSVVVVVGGIIVIINNMQTLNTPPHRF